MKREESKPLEAKPPPDHEFAALIAEAYQVFACEKPTDTGVCDCCMDRKIQKHFFDPDIEAMPLHYLQDWYFGDTGTEFTQHTWRYLLPRVLEVLASGETLSGIGVEVSLKRFPTGVRENWQRNEWSVLDRFQRMYLHLAAMDKEDDFDGILCMFGAAGWPLASLFDQVLKLPPPILAERLWNDWCRFKPPGVWVDAFWSKNQEAEVYSFYRSRELLQRMSDLAFDPQTPPELADKALAVAAVVEG